MHEWIVVPGMPAYLDVCMHGRLYVCIDALCVTRTRFLSSEASDLCFGAPEVGSDESELSSDA